MSGVCQCSLYTQYGSYGDFADGVLSRVVPFVSRVVNVKVGWSIHDTREAHQSSRVARKTHERMEGEGEAS